MPFFMNYDRNGLWNETDLVTQPFFDTPPSELFVTNSVSAMVYAQTIDSNPQTPRDPSALLRLT